MYNHVVWDFDGTLFDTYYTMAEVFQRLLKKWGFDEPVHAIMANMKVSMSYANQMYRDAYGLDDSFFAYYDEERKKEELAHCKPFDGVFEICRDICADGKYNYLCTHRGNTSFSMLKKFGLYEYFRDFTTSENGFERKPSPQALDYLIETYGLTPSEMIMIGDRELDILAGKNAGTDACFFAGQGGSSLHADYTIQSFSELYELLGIEKGDELD